MTELTPNIPLLRKAVEWAEAEAVRPDQENCEWWQKEYEAEARILGRKCGTCYCIAGWILKQDGQAMWDGLAGPGDRAAALLGIDPDQHHGGAGLFDQDNTIKDVRRIAEGIAAEAGERL